jgi:serine/threonine protein kinase/formylglycine-generating enzyme required for sulfatase activity
MDSEQPEGDPQASPQSLRAEELFRDWLVDEAQGRAPGRGDESFDELCRANSEVELELRELHRDWLVLHRTRSRIAILDRVTTPSLRNWVERWMRAQDFRERYEVRNALGEGGQAQVKEAMDRTLGRSVAVKTLRTTGIEAASRALQESQLARFLAEAQITAQLDHPGVVAVHELSLDERGQPYFTMTHVRGEELREVIARCNARDPRWPQVRVLSILLRVCETVRFAHARGVVHRDLKPANIMVGAFGEVFVMDWGLAHVRAAPSTSTEPTNGESDTRATGSASERIQTLRRAGPEDDVLATAASENLGTVYYMAPEVAQHGAVDPSPTVDVYALGAILYELLTGAPPYRREETGRTRLQVLEDVRRGPPAPFSREVQQQAPELVSIAQRALARDPRERYESMEAFATDLRNFLEGRVVRAHEVGAWAELRKWLGRNRKLAAALGLAFVCVVAGLVAVAQVEKRAREELDLQADLYRLPYLEREATRLWPEHPSRIPALEAWLASAERLAQRLALHERALEELRTRASEQLQHETLRETVAGLRVFSDAEHGLLAEVRRRLEWARNVERLTLLEPASAWARAEAAVARVDGPYRSARLVRTLGLVPLGADPQSRLEEFAFARSGAVPARDSATGELKLDEASAIVFVLLPGGEFRMGAQASDADAPGFDPLARPEEGPVHEVRLASFWIAKHELTRGQWARLGGGRSAAATESEGGAPDRHPVEGVSWNGCVELLAHFGLALPTEAQWEYAARGATEGGYLGHDSARGLAGYVNLADSTVVAARLGWPQAAGMEWLTDGFVRHAPVGSFAANRFGLHDVLGNVWEWCVDEPGAYTAGVQPGNGLRIASDALTRVARGGGFLNNAAFARTTIRDTGRSRTFDSPYHGARPVFAAAPLAE